jgi:hypothetical protein
MSIFLQRFNNFRNHKNGFNNTNSLVKRCDLYIDQEGFVGNQENPKTIYIRSNNAKYAINYLKHLKNPFILISGSDDKCLFNYISEQEKVDLISNENCKKIFTENCETSEKVYNLPTGMYHDYNVIKYFEDRHILTNLPNKKKFKIFCQFNNTHPSREEAKKFSIKSNLCDFFEPVLVRESNYENRYETLKLMESYSFTLCPRGYGIDTHRLFEALVLKTIPIVESSSIDDIHYILPIVIVKKWEDLNEKFLKNELERLNSKYEGFMDCITMDFWWDYIKKNKNNIFLYFPIPKNANSSIRMFQNIKTFGWNDKIKFLNNRITCKDFFKNIYDKDVIKYFLSLTVVRNPYSRLLSVFYNRIKDTKCEIIKQHLIEGISDELNNYLKYFDNYPENITFDIFIEIISKIPDELSNNHFVSQYKFIPKDIDIIIKYEDNFIEKLKQINNEYNFNSYLKKTDYKNRILPNKISKKSKELIYKRYKKDFIIFNYCKNI